MACSSATDAGAPPPPTPTPEPPKPIPTIVLSADSMVASAIAGASIIAQDIHIAAGTDAPLTGLAIGPIIVTGGGSNAWISAVLSSPSAPATLTLQVDPRALFAGGYDATVPIGATGASTASVRIKLAIRAHPVLRVERSSIALAVNAGDSLTIPAISLTSSSDTIGALSVATPSCSPDTPWLHATLSGSTTPASLTFTPSLAGVAAGHYACRVDVTSAQALVDSAIQSVAVSLDVKQSPRLQLSQSSINDSAYTNGGNSTTTISVTNAGTGRLDQLVTGPVSYGAGSGWVAASLNQTVAPATLTITTSARDLGVGTYTASVPVRSTAPGVSGATQTVDVRLDVRDPPPKPFVFVISPSVLNFTMRSGGPSPPQQNISAFDENGGKSTVTKLVQVAGNGVPYYMGFLNTNVIPQSGPVGIQAIKLPPGSYSITYQVLLANGASANFTINLTVTP